MSLQTFAELAQQVQDRLQDPTSIYWRLNYEIYSAIAEAVNELMLIVGRPMLQYNQQITLQPNSVWQEMPTNMLAITQMTVGGGRVGKTTLRSMDYLQTSWTSAWESDRGPQPKRWGSLGMKYFFVHPAPVLPIQVQVAGVSYPVTKAWPYDGTETSPFHKEVDDAIEAYATFYCRYKDLGSDWAEGKILYEKFLVVAQRLSEIEDRRDDLVWTRALGTPTAPSWVAKR